MPIFEYRCADGHRAEELFLGTEKPFDAVECPYCGKAAHQTVNNRIVVGGYSQLELSRLEAAHVT